MYCGPLSITSRYSVDIQPEGNREQMIVTGPVSIAGARGEHGQRRQRSGERHVHRTAGRRDADRRRIHVLDQLQRRRRQRRGAERDRRRRSERRHDHDHHRAGPRHHRVAPAGDLHRRRDVGGRRPDRRRHVYRRFGHHRLDAAAERRRHSDDEGAGPRRSHHHRILRGQHSFASSSSAPLAHRVVKGKPMSRSRSRRSIRRTATASRLPSMSRAARRAPARRAAASPWPSIIYPSARPRSTPAAPPSTFH